MKFEKIVLSFISLFLITSESFVYANYTVLTDIPVHVYVENPRLDFETVWLDDLDIKSEVKKLFNTKDLLQHEGTPALNKNSDFEKYWHFYKDNYKVIRFQKNGDISIIFQGKISDFETKEHIEIFHKKDGKYEKVWSKHGKLIAFHIQPHTKEVVLFQHQYACCQSASHNIHRIRLINKEAHVVSRYFLGRDVGDMVGPFYPDSAIHNDTFYYLEKETPIRWSPKEVKENAFDMRAATNVIIHFYKGAVYKKLAEQNGWLFVLLFSGMKEEQSPVLNYNNIHNRGLYGWIKVQ